MGEIKIRCVKKAQIFEDFSYWSLFRERGEAISQTTDKIIPHIIRVTRMDYWDGQERGQIGAGEISLHFSF